MRGTGLPRMLDVDSDNKQYRYSASYLYKTHMSYHLWVVDSTQLEHARSVIK